MNVIEAMHARKSVRSFLPKPVPRKVLEEIVEAAQWAGSPGNLQPWEFAILGGDILDELKKRLIEKYETRAPSELPFRPPLKVPELYEKRRAGYREENDRYLFPPETENVEEKKRERFLSGARLFDAPNAIIIYMEKDFIEIPWAIMAIGLITQNVCLAAVEHGLATCIMGMPVDWPDMLRGILGVSESKLFFCGMPIGYPNPEAKINTMPRRRIPLMDWVHWYGV